MSEINYTPNPPPQTEDFQTFRLYLENELNEIANYISQASRKASGDISYFSDGVSPNPTLVVPAGQTVLVNIYNSFSELDDITAYPSTGELEIQVGGTYVLAFSGTMYSDTANTTVSASIVRDGVVSSEDVSVSTIPTVNVPVNGSYTLRSNFAERGTKVAVALSHDRPGTVTFTFLSANLTLVGERLET